MNEYIKSMEERLGITKEELVEQIIQLEQAHNYLPSQDLLPYPQKLILDELESKKKLLTYFEYGSLVRAVYPKGIPSPVSGEEKENILNMVKDMRPDSIDLGQFTGIETKDYTLDGIRFEVSSVGDSVFVHKYVQV